MEVENTSKTAFPIDNNVTVQGSPAIEMSSPHDPEPIKANLMESENAKDAAFPIDDNVTVQTSPEVEISSPQDPVPSIKPNPYAVFLTRFPYIVIISALVICGVLTWVCYEYQELPDFSRPAAGFETRGTEIMDCSITQEKLVAALKQSKLTFLPTGPLPDQHSRQRRQAPLPPGCPTIYPNFDLERESYMAFKSKSGANMFKSESLKALCLIEDEYISPHSVGRKCRNPSVAFYTANLRNKECSELNEDDIAIVSGQLKECSRYYKNGTMQCGVNCTLPDFCQLGGHIHQIFYYLADTGFAESAQSGTPFLKYTQITLISITSGRLFFQDWIDGADVQKGDIVFTAGYFGWNSKYNLFSDYLLEDSIYFGLAMALVVIVMLFYLLSPTLVIATVFNVGFSFIIAYFLYFFVFRMHFYPFVNLLGALLLIAVGADDVFIFHDMWQQAKLEQPTGNRAIWMSQAYYHAALSVTVTSLTTGAAFFSNLVSKITAIRCFGLFAGLGIMANLLLMLTWTPAVIVSIDIVTDWACKLTPNMYAACSSMLRNLSKKTSRVFESWFPTIIDKGRFVWLVLLFLLGIGGLVVTFYKPGLQLPKSKEFQLFPDWHPMEIWDKGLKLQFQFLLDADTLERGSIQPLYTWGLHNKDNGNWLDPNNTGILEYDKNFSPLKPESQVALLNFCHAAKNQSFSVPSTFNCFYDEVLLIGKEICSDSRVRNTPFGHCCDKLKFPFPEDFIKNCILQVLGFGGARYIQRLRYTYGAPIFNSSTREIVAMMMQTETKFKFDMNFEKMDNAYLTIHKFYEEQKMLMPAGMKSLCFSGRGWQFRFYDLQKSIAIGTYSSIGLSLLVAGIVMLLTSRNVIITLYALLTILLAIAVTVGTIVLMGWELGILESIAISLSVGLSIDFTIHYGVAYRVSMRHDSKARVHESFYRVGWAVAIAAFTTFLAGAAMLPSRILAYTKLGIFLMLVMSFSWIYATFFFQSLCHVIGPRGKFCQIPSPFTCCFKKKKKIDQEEQQEMEMRASSPCRTAIHPEKL